MHLDIYRNDQSFAIAIPANFCVKFNNPSVVDERVHTIPANLHVESNNSSVVDKGINAIPTRKLYGSSARQFRAITHNRSTSDPLPMPALGIEIPGEGKAMGIATMEEAIDATINRTRPSILMIIDVGGDQVCCLVTALAGTNGMGTFERKTCRCKGVDGRTNTTLYQSNDQLVRCCETQPTPRRLCPLSPAPVFTVTTAAETIRQVCRRPNLLAWYRVGIMRILLEG
jgi:hypothetical protein